MQTITAYLNHCEDHKQVLFRIKTDGKGYFVVDGREIPKDEWEAANPAPYYKFSKGDNIDSTTAWME